MAITRHNPHDPLPTTGHSVIMAGGTVTVSRYPDITAIFICDTAAEADILSTTLAMHREALDTLRHIHTRHIQWLIDHL